MAKSNRILLKLSGESLMGEQRYGIDDLRLLFENDMRFLSQF